MDIVSLSKLLYENQTIAADDEWLKKDLERELDDAVVDPTRHSDDNIMHRDVHEQQRQQTSPVKIIFSDIDGSLIHSYIKSREADLSTWLSLSQ